MAEPAAPSRGADIVLASAAYPPLRGALWLMTLLFLAAILYNVDRLIIGVLAEQIRADLQVSEVQMSLLIGLAYSLLGGFLGLFVGFYVDRTNRRTVLAISLTLWSLATLAGGLSATFGHLFVSRALVGLGEAAMAPVAMSMIADIFPPGKRGRALAIYSIGATIGTALSTIVPGLITGANLQIAFPGMGLLAPWRTTFVLCGLAGPVVALLLYTTTREPVRQGVIAGSGGTAWTGLKTNVSYLWTQRGVFLPFVLGFGLFYLGLLAITAWTAVFLQRNYGLNLAEIAGALGLTLLLAGLAGYLVGGVIFDARKMRRSVPKLGVMMIAPILALPSALAVLAPNMAGALALLAAVSFVAPILNVGNGALVQDLLPNNMRGFALSICSVLSAVLGVACGPLLVALTTEHLFERPGMIGYSILVVAAPALIAAALCYLLALRGLGRHIRRGSLVVDVMRTADAV